MSLSECLLISKHTYKLTQVKDHLGRWIKEVEKIRKYCLWMQFQNFLMSFPLYFSFLFSFDLRERGASVLWPNMGT